MLLQITVNNLQQEAHLNQLRDTVEHQQELLHKDNHQLKDMGNLHKAINNLPVDSHLLVSHQDNSNNSQVDTQGNSNNNKQANTQDNNSNHNLEHTQVLNNQEHIQVLNNQ